MDKDAEVLKSLMRLPPNERAAALAHWIYVQTSRSGDSNWNTRATESWDSLDSVPKRFNVLTMDTWVEHPELLDAWVEAITAYRREHAGEGKKP
jgi:hypothetical protein